MILTLPNINLFISYAHQDNIYFKILINRLRPLLNKRENYYWNIWFDEKIDIGRNWDSVIQKKLQNADIIMLLVSNNFLSSDYIRKRELKYCIEKCNADKLILFPILLAPCNLSRCSELNNTQVYKPSGQKFGIHNIIDFTFADLCQFQGSNHLIPNPNIDRYINELILSLEERIIKSDFIRKENVKKDITFRKAEKKFRSIHINKIPYYNTNELVGRHKLLNKIHNYFTEKENLILLYGAPGIGKSTIALAYANNPKFTKKYNHIAWATIVGDFKIDLIQNIVNETSYFMYDSDIDIKSNFNKLIRKLKAINGNNLLIIDNANDIKQLLEIKDDLLLSNWNILITSRAKIQYITSLEVLELPHEHARRLFYKYFEKENNNNVLDDLLLTIGKHTLLIELLAKVGNENPFIANIEMLLEAYKKKGLKAEDFNIDIQIGSKEDKLYDCINNLFDIDSLSDDEIIYLRYFCILPSIEIGITDLISFFSIKKDHKIVFVNTLNSLVKKGWLINNKYQFKCHQLTQEILFSKLKPDLQNCRILILNVYGKIFHRIDYFENSLSKIQYIKYAEKIWNIFPKNEKIILELEIKLQIDIKT